MFVKRADVYILLLNGEYDDRVMCIPISFSLYIMILFFALLNLYLFVLFHFYPLNSVNTVDSYKLKYITPPISTLFKTPHLLLFSLYPTNHKKQ